VPNALLRQINGVCRNSDIMFSGSGPMAVFVRMPGCQDRPRSGIEGWQFYTIQSEGGRAVHVRLGMPRRRRVDELGRPTISQIAFDLMRRPDGLPPLTHLHA